MPIFMDLHRAADFDVAPTLEEIQRNHLADLKVQDKYGVKFIQYWVNEADGLVFCLMEGPDKESCAAVHREAHGNMACNILEVKGGDYEALIGNAVRKNKFDQVENTNKLLDSGYRILLAAEIVAVSRPTPYQLLISKEFISFEGRPISHNADKIMAVFDVSTKAMECALSIIKKMNSAPEEDAEIRIGISAGLPVTENSNLYGATMQSASRLCDIASKNQALVSSLVEKLSNGSEEHLTNRSLLKIISLGEESLINKLLEVTDKAMNQPDFNVERWGQEVGLSRAQLYRKVTSLTGRSPHAFIKEARLKKALQLIRHKQGNIASVAFEVGFNNPSQFSENFKARFGLHPSQFLKRVL
jgi:AraC-like DNA-binding protein